MLRGNGPICQPSSLRAVDALPAALASRASFTLCMPPRGHDYSDDETDNEVGEPAGEVIDQRAADDHAKIGDDVVGREDPARQYASSHPAIQQRII